ncbi:PREDICTED: bcl-2-modifying factor [Phaethon lepturus]|uniref:bcl-2-modifying factor n=1 Tax=Phaethon lepturus TaxID=97097 RepID=UPI000530773C|nr:PREDICTED: bcl-2-modifying factor [Phaethon lepturus]
MDRPSYLEEDYSSLDGLDDDVFHSDDFGLAGQPGEMTATGIFTQNQSYSCLLGRFQLFPLTHCCGPGIRHPEQQDKATQTLSPSSSSQDVMLPCGVTEEPRRLFYGNAGYRLHVPPVGFALDPHLQEEPQEGQREARAEVQIARKLQCIADQFHRLHIQRLVLFSSLLTTTVFSVAQVAICGLYQLLILEMTASLESVLTLFVD